jgi:hypothetical protein
MKIVKMYKRCVLSNTHYELVFEIFHLHFLLFFLNSIFFLVLVQSLFFYLVGFLNSFSTSFWIVVSF